MITHRCLWEIISSSQPSLKEERRIRRLRNLDAPNLDFNLPRWWKDVNPGIGILGMIIYLRIFLEPSICFVHQRCALYVAKSHDKPKALNSNLTSPSNGPFSKIRIRSVLLLGPLTVAVYAEFEPSVAALLVSTPGVTAERGIQNCGKYLCSQTQSAEVVSKRNIPSKRARTRRGVFSTLWGPEVRRFVARVWRLHMLSAFIHIKIGSNLLCHPEIDLLIPILVYEIRSEFSAIYQFLVIYHRRGCWYRIGRRGNLSSKPFSSLSNKPGSEWWT